MPDSKAGSILINSKFTIFHSHNSIVYQSNHCRETVASLSVKHSNDYGKLHSVNSRKCLFSYMKPG